ncbi:hypothetical protein [Burkholderia vietnamiensis]|uniref:Uncharacterized protein n=1 Tax=Burkholderia vietnamiensis (strain G4 / LMG 22486) TaxID=269482 RepID=A4JP09_BURVG|nr:hypothetical protein [Burkholderia vietnamiensis]ABO58012.1 hypothetical protein Bcep1808_5061 [Burkholderia vietnamiensis G4]KVS19479.1 hypothetical protein WK32_21120 [Burkholderia vietnamiensis]
MRETTVASSHPHGAVAIAANPAPVSRATGAMSTQRGVLHCTSTALPHRRASCLIPLAPFLHIGRSRNRATDAPAPCRAPDDNLTETAT